MITFFTSKSSQAIDLAKRNQNAREHITIIKCL